jgi:hypothetical protein
VRFRSKERPRGILRPGVQQRITLGIAVVGLIAIGLSLTGRSSFWSNLISGSRPVRTAGLTQDVTNGTSSSSASSVGLLPDEFTTGIPEDGSGTQLSSPASVVDQNEARRFERLSRSATRDPALVPPALTPDILKRVQDDVIGILSSEQEAYYECLKFCETLTAEDFKQAPEGRYSLFMDAPNQCRGRVWTLRGTLRKLTPFRSRTDSFGTKNLYDAWVSLPDSGSQLVHIVTASIQPGLAQVDEDNRTIPREVQLTGIFFKREGYVRAGADGSGDISLTPFLLASSIVPWVPPQMPVPNAEKLTPWLGWLSLIIVCSVLGLLWQFQISDSIFRRTRTHQLTALPVRVPFDEVEVFTVGDTLRQMEKQNAQDGGEE